MPTRGFTKIRGRSWTFVVVLLYGLVLLLGFIEKTFGEVDPVSLYQDAVTALFLFAVVAGPFLTWYFLSRRRKNQELRKLKDFAHSPWLFDRSNLEIIGRIEVVFSLKTARRMKLKFTDMARKISGNTDMSQRFPHQKFLLSSPALKSGERIMIIHNESFGKLALREGQWASVRGQYINKRSAVSTRFGRKLSFYGLIHETHHPRGRIQILDRKPEVIPEVKIISSIPRKVAESLAAAADA